MPDNVLVYIRPELAPRMIVEPQHLLIEYKDRWVRFDGGRVVIEDVSGNEKIPGADDCCPKCSGITVSECTACGTKF